MALCHAVEIGKEIAVRLALVAGTLLLGMNIAQADSAPGVNPFTEYADPDTIVAAVQTNFESQAGQKVRLAVYANEQDFLEVAAVKHQGVLNEDGLALVKFLGLAPGEYSFAAYLDENGDGKLNRGALGIPQEPIAFSNGIVPRWSRPDFDETKVAVAPGSVVVITLED